MSSERARAERCIRALGRRHGCTADEVDDILTIIGLRPCPMPHCSACGLPMIRSGIGVLMDKRPGHVVFHAQSMCNGCYKRSHASKRGPR